MKSLRSIVKATPAARVKSEAAVALNSCSAAPNLKLWPVNQMVTSCAKKHIRKTHFLANLMHIPHSTFATSFANRLE
eukprot:4463417-Pleurochrysis_carterae.AAC.1